MCIAVTCCVVTLLLVRKKKADLGFAPETNARVRRRGEREERRKREERERRHIDLAEAKAAKKETMSKKRREEERENNTAVTYRHLRFACVFSLNCAQGNFVVVLKEHRCQARLYVLQQR